MNKIKNIKGKYKITALAVIALMIGTGVFYACNKDKEFDITQDAKLMGSTGIWDCNVENPIGTIIVPEGQTPPCTRYFVKRIWNEAKKRYSSFSHTTEIHQCGAMGIFANIEFVAELVPAVLNAPPGVVIDYTNINNFNLRVDGKPVTPTFLYEKPFTYKITTPDGNVITKTGKIRITREDVLNVWEEINGQMEWGGEIEIPEASATMRVFTSMGALYAEINKVSAMDEQALQNYENAIGFRSFGRVSESVYWQILKQLGRKWGYDCELGAEEMNNDYIEFTVADAQMYVSQYPDYLDLCLNITEGGGQEYEFIPKYYSNPFRYVVNRNKMFQVGENVFKIFKIAIIYTSTGNANALSNITEANIENVITNIEAKEAAGIEGPIYVFMSSKSQKSGGDGSHVWGGGGPDGKGIEVDNNRTLINMETGEVTSLPIPGTPGCSNKQTGYLERYWIETISNPSSTNKERVGANFYCYPFDHGYDWLCESWYSMYAQWRGCKNCVWISTKRHLHSSFCIEVYVQGDVYSVSESYHSSALEKGMEKYIFRKDHLPHPFSTSTKKSMSRSIYNLSGVYWIGAVSCTLDFGIPIKKGR